jgi:hypothetical protein
MMHLRLLIFFNPRFEIDIIVRCSKKSGGQGEHGFFLNCSPEVKCPLISGDKLIREGILFHHQKKAGQQLSGFPLVTKRIIPRLALVQEV